MKTGQVSREQDRMYIITERNIQAHDGEHFLAPATVKPCALTTSGNAH